MSHTEKLEEIVQRLLAIHGGGEAYFDNLDAELRRAENLDIVRSLLDVQGAVVASGRFGQYLLELRRLGVLPQLGPFVLLSGGLRRGSDAKLLQMRGSVWGGVFTFIDDSYYSGTTEAAVRSWLETRGALLGETRVVYDGSPVKLPHVFSLYRYYDLHPR